MLSVYKKVLVLLDNREKKHFLLLLVMIILMSLLEVVGVAAIFPFLAVLANPDIIEDNRLLFFVYQTFSFSETNDFLFFLAGTVFILVTFGLIFKAFTMYLLIRFSTMRNYSISSRLLERYLAQPYVWFLKRNSADLGKTILSEVDHVIRSSIIPAMTLLAHASVVVALTVLLFFLEPLVMILATVSIAGSYLFIFLGIRGLLSRIGEERVEANGQRFQLANEAIGGIKDVKLLALENNYLARFRKPAYAFARTQALGTSLGKLPRYLLELVCFGGMLVLLMLLLARSEGRIEDLLPVLGVFAFAGVRMFPAMQQVYLTFTQLRFGRFALDSLHRDFLNAEPGSVNQSDGPTLRLKTSLDLRDVSFTFPEASRNAVNGLSLAIPANTTFGLVGGSGAGKTTTVDIILGLLNPQTGGVYIDGELVTDETRHAWQRNLGYVPQSIFLTDDTIVANVAFGIPPDQVDFAAVKNACETAGIHQFIVDELPGGYQTIVGERGVRLSGGQRQRIGIARALYHNPDVLVFDEATSALDTVTEQAVMHAIHELSGKKTIIIIAHRLSTIANCDQIAVLEHGRLISAGNYDHLVVNSTRFKELVDAAETNS